jgi:pyrimidine deaminase RibD-like protein
MSEPRLQFMQDAIAAMNKSVHEDQKPRPRVGVVVARGDKHLGVGWRGQNEPGEHAEFGLLNHELVNKNLKGAVLYTTLEPCTVRESHPKLACAEWIISRGITEVVIGVLDPNPKICGRGFWMLREAGIRVHFFPPSLMKEIELTNRDFFDAWELWRRQITRPSGPKRYTAMPRWNLCATTFRRKISLNDSLPPVCGSRTTASRPYPPLYKKRYSVTSTSTRRKN